MAVFPDDGSQPWSAALKAYIDANAGGSSGLASAYTISNVTTDRSYDANSTSLDELADVLGTVIADVGSSVSAGLVAANNAPARVKAAAQYVCDGVADQTEINNALAANLTVTLSEGTFKITAPIIVGIDRATLRGTGMGTIIQPQTGFASTGQAAYVVVDNGGGTTPVGNVTLRDFFIDGNNVGTFGGNVFNGINFRGYYGRITGVFVYRPSNYGILIQGYPAFQLFDWAIDHCIVRESWQSGFVTQTGAGDGVVTSCKAICVGNKSFNAGIPAGVDSTQADGFRWSTSSIQSVNCHPYGCGGGGFHFDTNTVHHHLTGCKIEGNRHGLMLENGSSSHQIIGNNFRGGVGTAISSHILTPAGATVGITSCLVVGNDFVGLDDNNVSQAQWAINFQNFVVQFWHIADNTFYVGSYGGGGINNLGTTGASGQTINNNSGYLTEGNGTVAVSTTSTVVTHGLNDTPLKEEITLSPQGDTGAFRYWVSAVTATTFTITFSATPTAHTMGWSSRRRHR